MNTKVAYEISDLRKVEYKLGPVGVVTHTARGVIIKSCNYHGAYINLEDDDDENSMVQDDEAAGQIVITTEEGAIVLTKLTLSLYRDRVLPFVPVDELFEGDDDCNQYWYEFMRDLD